MTAPPDHLLARSGKLDRLIADFDWSSTCLGDMSGWPNYLKSTIRLLVDSALPIVSFWGRDGVMICNDAFLELIGDRHAAPLGAKASEGWPEALDLKHHILRAGLAGRTGAFRDEKITVHRRSTTEIVWMSLDYSPIRDDTGMPVGVWVVVRETTDRVTLERQRAADALHLEAAETRRLCLLELGDRLRSCETAAQISGVASEVLGRVLGCIRTGYAVIEGRNASVENDWNNGTVKSLSGHHEFSSLGPHYVDHIRRGEILVVPDVRTHTVTTDTADCWPPIGVTALLNVPLQENGTTVGIIYAHDSRPREWTSEEVSLVQEVADRIWEAMGRARAVEALRRMNDTLETRVHERTLQRDRMWMLSTDIMMVTHLDGKIVAVNPAWTRLLGWQERDLIGASFYDFIHPDDIAPTRIERGKVERGQMIEKLENRYCAKDGRTVWLSWKAVPDGDLVHSVARDVTAEREQADALRGAEEALRQAQKMEAIGQLTGGIAHDFNNLLQGILGALELAERCVARGRFESLANYHAQAKRSVERAGALTHRLLAFSRRQPLDPKPVQANDLVLAMEPLLRHTLGESIQLEFDLSPDLWPTLCDSNQLDSAILNLTINARDAMPGGGTLTIRSTNVAGCARSAEGLPSSEGICISVTDTGVGMAPDVVARVFEPFFTTKPTGQGTGLGLSMVYGFMRQSGGEAKVASTLGVGTTISLHLPRHTDPDEEIPLDDSATKAPDRAAGQGTIMVIEDDPVVRFVIVDVLKGLGFQVVEAEDGPSGLEILQSSQSFDLLVTDIGLPGLNGRQVAEAARLTRPLLKVLFMTGYAETAAMSDGVLAPGMEMITKPFAVEGLTARVLEMTSGQRN